MFKSGRTALAALWTAGRAVVESLERRALMAATFEDGIWYIEGDGNADNLGDRIVIDLLPSDTDYLRATINGKFAGKVLATEVEGVEISAGQGNDRVTIDLGSSGTSTWFDVYGGEGNDTITGGGEDDFLSGDEGDDLIDGGGGADELWGGAGADTLNGDTGADDLYGGIGDDELSGDTGNDELWGGWGEDDLDGDGGHDDLYGGGDDDDLDGDFGRDELEGGKGDDELDGDSGNDSLSGGLGDDEMMGDGGDDHLEGNRGDDTMAGGLGEDEMAGGRGEDGLNGGFEDDELLGGKGEDTLAGGDGEDTLSGGEGSDTVFAQPEIDHTKWDRYDVRKEDQRVNPLSLVGENDEALKAWIIEEAIKEWRSVLGTDTYRTVNQDGETYWGCWGACIMGRQYFSIDAASEGRTASAPSHSDTNVQEQGVDEADLVETDGNYIYMLHGDELIIIDSLPAGESKIVSRTKLTGYASGIYLDGNRVTVISETYDEQDDGQVTLDENGDLITDQRKYEDWHYWNPQALVTVYNISDRENPRVIEETKLSGYSSESRVINGRLYLVMDSELSYPPPAVTFTGEEAIEPDEGWEKNQKGEWVWVGKADDENSGKRQPYWEPELGEEYTGAVKRYEYEYETEEQYRARLEAMSLADLLPGYTSKVTKADGTVVERSGSLADASSLYRPDGDTDDYAWSMFSVVLLDLRDNQGGPDASTSVVGWDGTVYASQDAMYVTTESWDSPIDGWWRDQTRTDIYKFALGEDSVPFEASGSVPGWTINQFAMDEEGNDFRIATTSSSRDGTSNNVFVMNQEGDDLFVTGGITNLAFSERIYSVRFVGDRGYVVTFRQVDPLFTIDLSDSQNPTVEGILKIPGYSSYLHPIDENFVLGVGRAGNDAGQIGGVQVSLFDVSDIRNPKRVGTHTFEADDDDLWRGNTWSAAEWDHHAFSYFPEQQVLALPMVSYRYTGEFQQVGGLEVLKVDFESGFTYLGQVQHDGAAVRSLRIGEYLYSIGRDAVKVVELLNPTEQVGEVDLPPVSYSYYGFRGGFIV